MDLVISKRYLVRSSQALSPITSATPGSSIFRSPMHSSDASFPIIAIAVIGIMATAFLLVSYYIFVIKCCLSWHRIDILRRFSLSRRREQPSTVYSPGMDTRGLDESVIRSIPILQFKKESKSRGFRERSFCECAVCLNEFQEDEKLRIIPNCSHLFHIDCIDVWLQSNANCPLCRTSISVMSRFQTDLALAPSSTPEDPTPCTDNPFGDDEDFLVIELGNDYSPHRTLLETKQRLNSSELSTSCISPTPRKLEYWRIMQKKERKFNKVTSMGDECIDTRSKDEQFAIQPIRRSFSMDSSSDRQLYLAIQEALPQNMQVSEVSPIEGSSSRIRRSIFSFGHGSRSRSSILPVYSEP
ncbi:RING-H2 finger protein ATL16-like [Juglans microcarpa x Juglans regia]|uniref:RING-H2 finger protein ATL16-like n=1 Tax=Juglans microcarpa x Juglans regia TaxID=2249226 RepID=UPI001B7F0868|nr:RING-H2 finger protein ATL16-like [Juglans microcarpa x Juglans regia]